ncbi:hypothetical protein [Streptomyces sp. NPDC127098]|uniref:hypothetical protein n=1 Tax=Streptomyces sp. NPDC127098 TaxID=3347137 RepID=UPI00364BBC72
MVRRLDAGVDDAARAGLVAALCEEYATAHGSVPLGFVAVCRLGPPYVDHTLNLLGSIVRHYGPTEPMPAPFESARMLVRTGAYAWVEVFDDGLLLPVHEDGQVVGARRGPGGGAGR